MLIKPELSIIILNYNTKELLADCLNSIKRYEDEVPLEVIVSDNDSKDGSIEMVKNDFPWVIQSVGENSGFAKGNNRAKDLAHGNLILFLNPDTKLVKGSLVKCVSYLKEHTDVGALTCKLVLPTGELDKDARRSFPTPWVSFSHLILHADRLFPKSKLFGKYWYGYVSPDVTHEVDAIQGAFFLTYRSILDKVHWFSEEYFLDGEDLDLCFKIRKLGWKIIYYPETFIYHIKGAAKGKAKKTKSKVPFKIKLKSRLSSVNSMEIFYKKNLWSSYPLAFNYFVLFGIKCLKTIRIVKLAIMG
jgi:hypothetical protein